MKKIIIITRDREYPINCNAHIYYSRESDSECNCMIHSYIRERINKLLIKPDERQWNNLAQKGTISNYKELWGADKYKNYRTISEEKGIPPLPKPEWRLEEVSSQVDKALVVENNKPYVHFNYQEKFDVYFVFLNRIFDTFVDGSEEYDALVDDEHRLKFIEAICQDCGISKETQEKAILYIHDKEWYVSDKSYSVLLKGQYINEESLNNNIKEDLAKYFSTIKVFLHNENHIFNEIKRLDFTEEDEEVVILNRGYF